MKVCLGGTFNLLHIGHERLFSKAFELGDQVAIGLTSDELIKDSKEVEVAPYEDRKARLEEFLDERGWKGRYSILPLKDELGPAVWKDFNAIIVSEETRSGAEKINKKREENSLKPLKIVVVELVLAQNGEVISATRIKKGEMDPKGRLCPR